jgi:hypothetical protein
VDCPKQIGDLTEHSLRIDAAGNPNIAYGGEILYYARHDGSVWQYEVADSTLNVGCYASLALDSGGYPHISYFDSCDDEVSDSTLMYAHKDMDGWHVEVVTVTYNQDATLALDNNGYPHISYYDGFAFLKYAYQDGSGWHFETVDNEEGFGRFNSLALDSSGYPHISYSDRSVENLKYAY